MTDPYNLSETQQRIVDILGEARAEGIPELYGREIRERSEKEGSGIKLTRGRLYEDLDILQQKKGLVSSREEPGKPPLRRIYKLTESGIRARAQNQPQEADAVLPGGLCPT